MIFRSYLEEKRMLWFGRYGDYPPQQPNAVRLRNGTVSEWAKNSKLNSNNHFVPKIFYKYKNKKKIKHTSFTLIK